MNVNLEVLAQAWLVHCCWYAQTVLSRTTTKLIRGIVNRVLGLVFVVEAVIFSLTTNLLKANKVLVLGRYAVHASARNNAPLVLLANKGLGFDLGLKTWLIVAL